MMYSFSSTRSLRRARGEASGRVCSGVAVPAVAQDRVTLDQLVDAGSERIPGPESGGLDPLVGDDVVALVGVLADGRLEVDEAWHMLADLGTKLQLREIRVA